ncbi:MAG: ATP-binding protein [bacterium]
MLIKQKLTLGSLSVGVFIILVAGIVLIDSNKSLTKTIRLTTQWNNFNSSIATAREEEKNYFILGNKVDQAGQSPMQKFKAEIAKAKELGKSDREIMELLDKYAGYFQTIVTKNNINDQTIKTLKEKGNSLQSISSQKVEVIQAEAVLVQKKIYSTFLIAFILVGFASIGGGVFVSRLVTVPLARLVAQTKKISQGGTETVIQITTEDEIGELAGIFNKLGKEVIEAKQQVERKAREIELQVEKQVKQLKAKEREIIQSERTAAVGQLAAVVSGALKVSLNNVKNLAGQLKELVNPEDKKAVLNIRNIEKEVAQLMRMGVNVATYAKPPVPELATNDINKIIEEILALKEKEGALENIKTVRRLIPHIPRIPLDEELIKQAFDNLVTNACQAMPVAGELIVSTTASPEEIEVKISDSGAGISEANLSKIFNPFFTTVSEGLGLGLTMVREIIKQHHGSIAVQSSVGKGTMFIIKLPVNPEKSSQSNFQDSSKVNPQGGSQGNPQDVNTDQMTTR